MGQVANLALLKGSERSASGPPRRQRPLNAGHFVGAAAELLQMGESEKAAEIFIGLVKLDQQDGEALNHLGFCMLAYDPRGALQRLQQASLLPRLNPLTNIANRILALHLVGRNGDATELAKEGLAEPVEPGDTWLWMHASGGSPLVLSKYSSVSAYIFEMLNHIQNDHSCESTLAVL